MFAAAVISLVAVSCSLFGDEEPSAERNFVEPALTASVSGSVSVSGAVPGALRSSAARTALPSLGEELSYSVEASDGGRKYTADVDAENLSFSFGEIAVVEGGTEYAITASGKIGDETVLFGEVKKTLKPGDAFFCEVPVKPYMKSGTGSVSLEIDVSETKIRSCAIELDGGSVSSCPVDSGGKILFEKTLDSGCYDAVFSFYSTADSSSADGVLLYEFRESVHVCKSLVTDSWFGSSAYIADGKCKIKKALVDKFALSRIYVSSKKSDSKETGTRAEPYKSVARAMNALLDKDTDYTILVDGELTGAQEIPDTLTTEAGGTYKAKSLVIKGAGAGAKINGNNEGTALTIRTAVPVTIENLTITGGKNASGNGGGIYMGSGTKVTLGTGTLVGDVIETTNMAAASNSTYGNIAKNGGGIYNDGGTLILGNGSYISHNFAGGTTLDSGEAGGIFVNGGSLEIKEGASVRLNKCVSRGGGISLYGGCSVTITGGSIEFNEVEYWGGGIFCGSHSGSVSFDMSGGSISHNKSTLSSREDVGGGGIYLDATSASFSMSGTALISENSAKQKGGALVIGNGSSFEMTGGTISKNWSDASGSGALTGGGAVFLYGTLKMSGNANIPLGALVDGTLVTGVNKNDVKFYLGATVPPTVVITGALTASTTVATITLSEWKRGTTVVQANTNISGYKDYFAFTDEGWETLVATDKKSLFINQPIYVAGATTHPVCGVAGSDGSGANGTKSHPYATIAQACTIMNDETVDYILKIDGEVTGAQEIPDTLTKTTSGTYKAKSLTLCGASGLDSNNKPQDTLHLTSTGSVLSISTNVPVTIKDLSIFGSESSSTPTTGLTLATGKSTDVTISNGVLITKNYNSGVNISSQGKLTMTGGDITTNRAKNGAGVVNDGTFIMTGGYISANITNSVDGDGGNGGGVYITSSGKLEMSGGYIIRNTAGASTTGNGGGVYFSGTFEFQGGEIWGNLTYNNGGGLYADGGTLIMGGTAELGNKNVYSPPTFSTGDINRTNHGSGGAIYSKGASNLYIGYTNTNGTPTVSNFTGCITGNYARVDGGGIYTTNEIAVFNISGGTISYNAADGNGGAIYSGGKLSLLNKAYIPVGRDNKNDLYLISGKTVALSDSLASGTVATITPQEYAYGTPILSLAEASSTTIEAERAKFSINQQSEQLEIFDISNEGYLTNVVFSFDRAFPNGTVYGTEVHEDKTYIAIKYRYTQYDSLSMSITNPFADMGWSMEFNLDDVSTDPASVTTLSDGYHTLSATLSKGSESVTAVTRVRAMIKPVTVTVPKVKGFITRGDGYRISLNVYLYIQGKNGDEYTQEQTIAHWSGVYDTDFNSEPATNNDPVILTAKDSTFYFYTSQAVDEWNTSGPLGLINRGYEYTTRTLADLKKSKSFDSQCVNSSGNKCSDSGKRAHYWFTATLDDSD